ncbi:MAG: metal-dependent transcriptional regulator [Burkholderiales bacterium]
MRRHRLLECFLVQVLKYDLHEAHNESERLKHHISCEFEEKIDALLGHTKRCPHGSSIPNRNGNSHLKARVEADTPATGSAIYAG